jgi:multimeric flavodoxin WrbA
MRTLLGALLDGARHEEIEDVDLTVRTALEATADDVLAADGYLLATPANFGYMSGALKHFFDSTFLAVGGALSDDGSAGGPGTGSAGGSASDQGGSTAGRPYGLLVHGRYDTAGAVRSVQSIVGALKWRQAAGVLEVMGDVTHEETASALELGATVAALISPA